MRERLVMPVIIPLGVAAVIVLMIVTGSKVLLDVSREVAPVIAGVLAVLILGIATLVAEGPRLRAPQVYVLTALPAAALIAVGLFIAARPTVSTETEGGPAAVTEIEIDARDNLFVTRAFTVPVGQPVTVNFVNTGSALHNWQMKELKNPDGSEIKTEILPSGGKQTVTFTVAQAGTFDFLCIVHATQMVGKVTAVAGGSAGAPSGPVTNAQLTTIDDKFEQASLTVPANQEITVAVQNKGRNIHNFRVLGVKSAAGADITTQLLPAGGSETVKFTITAPGTYEYQCDVHAATMKGKLTVQ